MQKTVTSKNARILMVGAGQTNALFARFLAKKGFHHVTILNRTPDKAAVLAGTFDHGRAFPLNVLEYWSEGFDALVVCTGSTEPVVTPDVYHSLVAGDKTRKTVVDLSVPNNVDKRMLAEHPVHFIEIEALRATAEQNRSHREHEKTKADTIITRRLYEYHALWHERQVERSLAYIPDEVRAVKERAVQEVYAKDFAQLDPAAQELVMKMLGYMEKKCVAIPIKAAKSIALHALKQQGGRAEKYAIPWSGMPAGKLLQSETFSIRHLGRISRIPARLIEKRHLRLNDGLHILFLRGILAPVCLKQGLHSSP